MSVRRTVVVAVPTFRRPAGLARLLAALAVLDEPECDWSVLVVVNDGTQPPVPELLLARTTVRVVQQPVVGAASARNKALEECGSRLVAFIDDDVVPDRAWLRELVKPVLDGVADGSSGKVVLDPSKGRPGWWVAEWMDPYLAALDRGTEPRLLKADEYFLTANVCLPVEPLRHLGGFDSALGPKEGRPMVNDDLQVSADLLAAGITFAWTPSATVVHDVPDSRLQPLWFASRLHCQGRSDLLLARHFDQVSTGDGLRLARERAWNAVHGLRYRAGWTRAHLMFILGSLIRAEGLARESLASSRIRKSIRRRARLG